VDLTRKCPAGQRGEARDSIRDVLPPSGSSWKLKMTGGWGQEKQRAALGPPPPREKKVGRGSKNGRGGSITKS